MQTVLITGCSSGFGKLTAQTFHRNGWNVVATMRSPEAETDLVEDDRQLICRLDVTDQASIDAALAAAIDRFGSVDVLVNNAGVGHIALFEQTSDEAARAVFDTNVFGLMNVSRTLLPHLREHGGGSIINVSSMAGMLGLPNGAVYAASKHAVEGLTEAMALECLPLNIAVSSVAPGVFDTSFLDNASESLDTGDDELRRHARRVQDHVLAAAGAGPDDEAGPDGQEVADKIYACATSTMPVHNPVGADAEAIVAMMNAGTRQQFIDGFRAMVMPD